MIIDILLIFLLLALLLVINNYNKERTDNRKKAKMNFVDTRFTDTRIDINYDLKFSIQWTGQKHEIDSIYEQLNKYKISFKLMITPINSSIKIQTLDKTEYLHLNQHFLLSKDNRISIVDNWLFKKYFQ